MRKSSEDKSDAPVYKAESFYRRWIEAEGIPIYEGFYIEDLASLELKPWVEWGAKGLM